MHEMDEARRPRHQKLSTTARVQLTRADLPAAESSALFFCSAVRHDAPSHDPASLLLDLTIADLRELRVLRSPSDIIRLSFEAAIALVAAAGPPGALAEITDQCRRRAQSMLDDGRLYADGDERAGLRALANLPDVARSPLLIMPPPAQRTMRFKKEEWRVVTSSCLPPWSACGEFIAARELLDLLAKSVDFDRALPMDSPLHEYLSLEPFTPHTARRAARCAEHVVRFLHAAADPQIRIERAWARRLPILCALAMRRAAKPSESTEPPTPVDFARICCGLATMGAFSEGALDGGLWRQVVAFV